MPLLTETMMKVNSVDNNATANGNDDAGLILLTTMLLLMEPMIKINQFLDFNVPSSAQGHLRMRWWRRWSDDEVTDNDWWWCQHSRTQEAGGVAGSMLSKLPNRKCWMMGNLASTCNSKQFRVSTCSSMWRGEQFNVNLYSSIWNNEHFHVHSCSSMWSNEHFHVHIYSSILAMNISMCTYIHPY